MYISFKDKVHKRKIQDGKMMCCRTHCGLRFDEDYALKYKDIDAHSLFDMCKRCFTKDQIFEIQEERKKKNNPYINNQEVL